MKEVTLYKKLRSICKDGDVILTEVNTHPSQREVTVKGDGVVCNTEWFWWDFFFEVNHPVGEEVEILR